MSISSFVKLVLILMTPTEQKLPLTYLHQPADQDLADGSAIFMMHGVGSNAQDLFSLAPRLNKNTHIFSLQGPLQMGPTNYGWYVVDFSTGKPTYDYGLVEKSRSLIIDFIEQAIENYDLDQSKIVLLGFSQGTIMSYSVAARQPKLVKGIAAFSGRMLIEDQEEFKNQNIDHLEIFMVHSQADRMLPFAYALEARQILESKVKSLEFSSHGYGHAIDPNSIELLNEWLEKLLD
ncbi:MAG: esterase [Rickettsiales bacterium]|nr:esterase [Rickettsiales bacterium]